MSQPVRRTTCRFRTPYSCPFTLSFRRHLTHICLPLSPTRNLRFTPIGGLSGLIAGLLVAVKQIYPEHNVGVFGAKIAAKFVPLIVFGLLLAARAVRLVAFGDLAFAAGGLVFGWVYLRYFQKREVGHGDLSESFAFQSFFPEPVAPFAGVISAIFFLVCKPVLLSMQGESVKSNPSVPRLLEQHAPHSSADPIDVERRRQRALRALDERISSSKAEIGNAESAV
jgi:hypothetical protein